MYFCNLYKINPNENLFNLEVTRDLKKSMLGFLLKENLIFFLENSIFSRNYFFLKDIGGRGVFLILIAGKFLP